MLISEEQTSYIEIILVLVQEDKQRKRFMIEIFEYVFFRIFNTLRKELKRTPEMSAIAFLSCAESCNVLSLFNLFSDIILTKFLATFFIIPIMIFNMIYFREKKRDQIDKKWVGNIQGKRHLLYGFLIVLYLIFSLIVFFISMFF